MIGESLRALVLAVCVAVLVWPLAFAEAAFSAFCATIVGCILGALASRKSMRNIAIVGIGIGVGVLSYLCAHSFEVFDSPARLLGAQMAFRVSDALTISGVAFSGAFVLRALSYRYRVATALEVGVIATAFAQLMFAHRYESINRPFGFADPILAAGLDPTVFLLAIGAVAALLCVALLIRDENPLSGIMRWVLLGALLFGATFFLIPERMPSAIPPDNSGLRGDSDKDRASKNDKDSKEQEEKGKSNEREQNGSSRPNTDNQNTFDSSPPPPELAQTPIGVVLLHNDYSPEEGTYYFRQSAFSQYNGHRLVEATDQDVDRDLFRSFPFSKIEVSTPPDSGFRREIESTVALLVSDHTRPPALEAPTTLEPVSNPDPARFKRIYRVHSSVLNVPYSQLFGRQPFDPAWSDETVALYTKAPDDPRYLKLAIDIKSMLPDELQNDPMAEALAVSAWLGKNGTYSIHQKNVDGPDPTASFLFGDRIGYCVHFAHAAAFLMRTMGLAARVATGYALPEAYRQGGSSLLIADADSHAWPEVYIDGAGWVIVDVAPENVLDDPPPQRDGDLQKLLGEMARGANPFPEAAEKAEDLKKQAYAWGEFLRRFVVTLLLTVVAMMFAIKFYRLFSPYLPSEKHRALRLYRARLDALSEVGIRRRYGESRERFADRIANQIPSFVSMTTEHLRNAFSVPQDQTDLMGTIAAEVREQTRIAVPLWKRVFGRINPVSWWWSR
ncbi:MAG: transglutaminase-like domain-containing protein [Polyangiales bacterium]